MEHVQIHLRELMVNLRQILLLVVLIHLNKKHHFPGLDKKSVLSKRPSMVNPSRNLRSKCESHCFSRQLPSQ